MNPLSERSLLLIRKYFRDELSEIEQKEFDKALGDPDFRSEVELQAQVFEGIVASRRENIQAVIEEAKSELKNKRSPSDNKKSQPKIRSLRWLSVAAVMLALACSLYFLFDKDKTDYDALYAEYYVPYDTPESQRGDNDVKNSPLDEAMNLYENEKYAEALSGLNAINPKTEYTQLLIANCHLNIGQSDNAVSILKKLSSSNDSRIVQQAEWYLALAYIKSNQSDLAKRIFDKIKSTPNHLYQKRVTKLMEDYDM